MDRRRPLVAGNWKMNGGRSSRALADELKAGYSAELRAAVDLLVCPPATLIGSVAAALEGSGVAVGGQDAHPEASGAFTGDISAEMLAEAGATHVIVGHSERRSAHGEDDATVRRKALAARRAGLVAIVCVGETHAEREAGQALDIVSGQLRGSLPDEASAATVVVAYEPVWAIGTGLTPTAADVAEVHGLIRRDLAGRFGEAEGRGMRILYGGSVKPRNARELLGIGDVDGALVGGASLAASDFLGIARACLPA